MKCKKRSEELVAKNLEDGTFEIMDEYGNIHTVSEEIFKNNFEICKTKIFRICEACHYEVEVGSPEDIRRRAKTKCPNCGRKMEIT